MTAKTSPLGSVVLALELSGNTSSLALRTPGGLYLRRFGGERGRTLFPELDALFAEAKLLPQALEGILVGVGPGSYTGLRIACSAARGLGWALDVPVHGLCSLAAAVLAHSPGKETHLLVDAYRHEFYHAAYLLEDDVLHERQAPHLLPAARVREALSSAPRLLCEERFGERFSLSVTGRPEADARELLRLAELPNPPFLPANPLYLRAAR